MRNIIILAITLITLAVLGQQSFIGHDCPLPTITSNPSAAVVNAGGNTNFSVSATLYISFQWNTNGVPITDFAGVGGVSGSATSTITLTNCPTAYNNLSFTCTVGNGCGSVTSTGATLTVNGSALLTESGVFLLQETGGEILL